MSEASGPVDRPVIGIVGGTGAQGRGLATRWLAAGYPVLLGGRDADRAHAVALELGAVGAGNAEVSRRADVIVLAVPWGAHAQTVGDLADALAGKVVVDCVNPLGFDSSGPYVLDVAEGSAAQQAQALAPQATVTAAFHHVSAVRLADRNVTSLDQDVLVLGDDRPATDTVIALADALPGVRGVYAGRLRNARQVEGLTANLIAVNRRYKIHAGVRITDL
ncbi:MAG: NADPH-dependent F420 reductase [uncultured Nocardioidaceae bacterium]|uniref:NADPH-dependent F420 reductase n=1 Tax=uncultured Nocardioidaceae bacterium TaxID=253824 RepID=A0A6J4LKA6_9ACTN|nr:MAG: NADPH-dependent F420 reductase [uncultured Nocardioidaceae bacterium]